MSMDRDAWRRAEQLFHAALDHPPQDRRALLQQACGDDEELRVFVEQLIAKDQAQSGFLNQPAFVASPAGSRPVSSEPSPSIGTRPEPAQPYLVGRRYGAYQFLSLLGAGGMGEVYRAHDARLDRDVAIKMLPIEFARDPGRLARLRREARVLASLNHPNIAAIYGLEETAEGDYLVLELVEGDDLRGPLPVRMAIDVASQVAEALQAAHAHGIVHRDLKPANVKVTPEGRVKVLDFGLAKTIVGAEPASPVASPAPGADDASLTGSILGTPGYMSPEQARGEAVDQRTDVWAFGCLLYELLTGRRAFERATVPDTVGPVLERVPDWQALHDATPSRLRDLLERCLRKEASARLATIGEARQVLLDLQRAGARQASTSPRARTIDAYELCLRARYLHQKRTPDGMATALRLFEQAIELDPDCALAHAGIAHVCLIACYFNLMPTAEGMPRMKAAALRAVELDDSLAVAHVRLGDVFCFKDWDWAGAEREFRRALELDADSPEALCRYGLFLSARRRDEESRAQLEKSLALDPFSLDSNWFLGYSYIALGLLDKAESIASRLIAVAPEAWLGYHVALGVKAKKQLWDQCVVECERMAVLERGGAALAMLCWMYARAGRRAEAEQTFERLTGLAAKRLVAPTWMAIAHDAVGSQQEALRCLERAIEERHMLLVHLRLYIDTAGVLERYRPLLDRYNL